MKEIEIPMRPPISHVALRGRDPCLPFSVASVILKLDTKVPLFFSHFWIAWRIVILAMKQLIGGPKE